MKIIGTFSILHKGYLDIIEKYPSADIYILNNELVKELTDLEKDIRKINNDQIVTLITALKKNVEILDKNILKKLKKSDDYIIVISDPITDNLIREYLNDYPKLIIESGFLYHKSENVKTEEKEAADPSKYTEADINYMKEAYKVANESGCWWRQIASVLVKDNKILYKGCNEMLPNKDECYRVGCVRDHIKPGEKMDFCSAIHSEVNVIAQAAQDGVATKGADLYVTAFPCPRCAKVIAKSGIKRVFYNQGWSNFDGERVLKGAGVELIKIDL